MTGLPLGTVRTIVRRSGAFTDNLKHRELFTLPPIQQSQSTGIAATVMPLQQTITGDLELDAVLWLREVIDTGNAAYIDKALEAAANIKTPPAELETRYMRHVMQTTGNQTKALFGSMGFANLEVHAKAARRKAILISEAVARFGTDDWFETEADHFCADALKGLKSRNMWLDEAECAARFRQHTDLMPHTLDDCLYELAYWGNLYRLRYALHECDHPPESESREQFIYQMLGQIRPRNKTEAKAVLSYLIYRERKDDKDFDAIVENLLS
ncbi:MAG TPA: hypothetical protein VJY83_00310 [Thiopseudomonas sp.]|nr:hypothetical protein [Thiopseudomonas sp.]